MAEPDARPDCRSTRAWHTSWGLFTFYLHHELELTLDDGKNAWRFLVREMSHCLEPAPAIVT